MYKLCQPLPNGITNCVYRDSDGGYIPFDPANTDYIKFKSDILAGAELLDANGNVMTAEQAQAFVQELP